MTAAHQSFFAYNLTSHVCISSSVSVRNNLRTSWCRLWDYFMLEQRSDTAPTCYKLPSRSCYSCFIHWGRSERAVPTDLLCAWALTFTYYSHFDLIVFVWYLSRDVRQPREKVKEVKQRPDGFEFNCRTPQVSLSNNAFCCARQIVLLTQGKHTGSST